MISPGNRSRTIQATNAISAVKLLEAPLPADEIVTANGMPCTTAARAVFDTARCVNFAPAVVLIEAALQRTLVTPAQLLTQAQERPGVRGSNVFAKALAFASLLSESVLESRYRLFFHHFGFRQPEQQVDIVDDASYLIARVSFLFRDARTIVEVDGLEKYTNLAYGSSSAPQRFTREKERDRRIEASGYRVIHASALDLEQPDELCRLLRLAGVA